MHDEARAHLGGDDPLGAQDLTCGQSARLRLLRSSGLKVARVALDNRAERPQAVREHVEFVPMLVVDGVDEPLCRERSEVLEPFGHRVLEVLRQHLEHMTAPRTALVDPAVETCEREGSGIELDAFVTQAGDLIDRALLSFASSCACRRSSASRRRSAA